MNVVIQLVNYTLALLMWLVIGRVGLSLFTSNRENFIMSFFIRFTEPIYKITRKIFPFAKVPPERQGTFWGNIEGCIPLFSVIIIITLRILLILSFGKSSK